MTFPYGHTTSFHGNEVTDRDRRCEFSGHPVEFFTDKTVEFREHEAGRDARFCAFVPYSGPDGYWPAVSGRAV